MNNERKIVLVIAIVLVAAGVVWFVGKTAPNAPDCSTIQYEGDGTKTNPYEVGNVGQLHCMGANHDYTETKLNDSFVQVSDIDASETSRWFDGKGFHPIFRVSTRNKYLYFDGTFDGQGHNITDLTIDGRSNLNGLFARIGTEGTVKNVSLIDADIDGSLHVGGLTGANEGMIKNSHVSGSIFGCDVGGLVGWNDGGKIENSYSTASVEDSGLGCPTGGLVGTNDGTIIKSYARGPVTSSAKAGGIVGTNTGIINESYATGSVSYGDGVEGLVGVEEGDGTVNDSYWDMNATGQPTSAGNATGLTTEEMTDIAARNNMRGFDFTDTWETVRDGYPVLGEDAAVTRRKK